VHAEAAIVIQRELRAKNNRKAKLLFLAEGGGGAKGMHTQAQKAMKNGAYEDAAKHLFSAYSLERTAREGAEKKLHQERAELQKQISELRKQNDGEAD